MDDKPTLPTIKIKIIEKPEGVLFTTKPHRIASYSPRDPKNRFGKETFLDLVLRIKGVNWAQLEDDYSLFITFNTKDPSNSQFYTIKCVLEIIDLIKKSSGVKFDIIFLED